MNQAVKKGGFNAGDIVTVINEHDIMHGLQGEVVRTYIDDDNTCELMVFVKFHVNVSGYRNDLRRIGEYYEGIHSSSGKGTFTYQDRSPNQSSIRLDNGYTEENRQKIGLQ